MARICLLTPGQPSINPRLVKEADALSEAGHDVQVICSHYIDWADRHDAELLRLRPWTCTYVGGSEGSIPYRWTRLRHRFARKALEVLPGSALTQRFALARVVPELYTAALATQAELYIARYPGALIAASEVAHNLGAKLGFDAEDFETGSLSVGGQASVVAIESVERRYLPRCDYVTAASPAIAQAYSMKYKVPLPTTILNVFPLAERPREFRETSNEGPLTVYWFSQTIGLHRGLEDVVRAVGLLSDCSLELHLLGRPAEPDWSTLLSLASRSGVKREQIVQHAPAPPFSMVEIASKYDVGLAPEQPEAGENRNLCLTNKIFTYLLAGNAVAATATRGQRLIMDRLGDAGFCFAPGDHEALACGLRHWSTNRVALSTSRRAAWTWGTREYNWDLEKKKFLAVIERTLQSERPKVLVGSGLDPLISRR